MKIDLCYFSALCKKYITTIHVHVVTFKIWKAEIEKTCGIKDKTGEIP